IHVATADFYPLPQEIEDAFAASKYLVVEVDMSKADKAKMQAVTLEKGAYKGEDTLSKSLSKPTLDLLNAYYTKSGMPPGAFDKFRPWMVATTIAMLELQKLGFGTDLGIDLHFLKAAGDKKEVLELESIESQMNLLSGFSAELQDTFLAQTLGDLGDVKDFINKAVGAWKNGDAKALNDLMVLKPLQKHPEMKPVLDKLIDERNVQMTAKVDGYLKGKGVYFVVVGAGHLVGDKGVVALLAARNYKVEQVRRAR
ncbi:MAG: TraB/GumN family protein, partial [Planctomycetota bacterium]|nr:TraB/GumN family protein [Planctomycetota bacterium]